MQVGMIIKLNHAVQKVSMRSPTSAFNATPHTSLIQLIKNADHAHLITFLTTKPEDASVKFHAQLQDKLTQSTTNANAQLTTEQEWFTKLILTNVLAHQTYHCGTVNIVLPVHQILNTILNKANVITAQKDLLEITTVMLASRDSDECMIDL
jgi:hypothetical protein